MNAVFNSIGGLKDGIIPKVCEFFDSLNYEKYAMARAKQEMRHLIEDEFDSQIGGLESTFNHNVVCNIDLIVNNVFDESMKIVNFIESKTLPVSWKAKCINIWERIVMGVKATAASIDVGIFTDLYRIADTVVTALSSGGVGNVLLSLCMKAKDYVFRCIGALQVNPRVVKLEHLVALITEKRSEVNAQKNLDEEKRVKALNALQSAENVVRTKRNQIEKGSAFFAFRSVFDAVSTLDEEPFDKMDEKDFEDVSTVGLVVAGTAGLGLGLLAMLPRKFFSLFSKKK